MKKHDDTKNASVDDQSVALQKSVEEWKNKYIRALADYQNLERRMIANRAEVHERSITDVIRPVLSFVDEIELAQKHMHDQGLDIALKGFANVLTQFGITRIDVTDKEFNPHEMECVEVVSGDKDNVVIAETRAGYKIGDRVLRVAQVKVSKKTH